MPRVDAGETARPGAADEAEQERLGLIVSRVADGDGVPAQALTCALEELVPAPTSRVL